MNARIGLIHSVLPATVDLRVKVSDDHPSARVLGSERMGSGTIIDPEGYILTVHYVTLGATSITVTLIQGDQFPGETVARDPESGLALIKISARDLPFMRPAPPASLLPGAAAFIIASSGESARRASGGYITSIENFDAQWEYMLDKTIRLTAVNPGFGGGTLSDLTGRLLGVVSLNLNEVGKLSLAIPIEYYTRYAQELKQHGRITSRPPRPWFGFYPQFAQGVVITGTVHGGPAEKSGLREGDRILSVNKKTIHSRPEFYREIWKFKPGERISFRVLRGDEAVDLEVTGGDRQDFYRA